MGSEAAGSIKLMAGPGLAKHRLSTQAPVGSEVVSPRAVLTKKKRTTKPNSLSLNKEACISAQAGEYEAEKLHWFTGKEKVALHQILK